jgi:hypothetical protein
MQGKRSKQQRPGHEESCLNLAQAELGFALAGLLGNQLDTSGKKTKKKRIC